MYSNGHGKRMGSLTPSTIKTLRNSNKKRRRHSDKSFPSVHGDPLLVSRISDLLTDSSRLDLDDEQDIVDHLQLKFPEYKRKKQAVLKQSVSEALKILDQDSGTDDNQEVKGQTNMNSNVNDSINNMYSQSTQKEKTKKRKSRQIEPNIDNLKQQDLKEKYLVTPTTSMSDLGDMDRVKQQIDKLVFHMIHGDMYCSIGIDPPKGFLLHGPHGVGKTTVVEAIAKDMNLSLFKVVSPELVTGISGESEDRLRSLFSVAEANSPCILFIDEIDVIAPRRETSSREMEKRIVAQLVACLDSLQTSSHVMVIGATSRPDSLDPSLRRAGRFDREINLGIPDESGRQSILQVLCRKIKTASDIDFLGLARTTPGFVGADLKSLIREAAVICCERNLECGVTNPSAETVCVSMQDFVSALKFVQPSAKREGFATVPDVSWDDIGALQDIRQELELSILAPIKYPADVKSLGLPTSFGLLLCGPPGCGKTLVAKAIANESGLNFISVKGPELLNMYVGESERAVRSVFLRAKNSKPCVLFFDEIDALCRRRSDESTSTHSSSVVNQLLTEMDGLESRSCILLAATNRPDILDPAILRPGRFDKIVYVGFPGVEERLDILKTLTRNGTRPPCNSSVDLKAIASDLRTEGFSGADLLSLVREASIEAFKARVTGQLNPSESIVVSAHHFEVALQRIKPSASKNDNIKYQKMKEMYSCSIQR